MDAGLGRTKGGGGGLPDLYDGWYYILHTTALALAAGV